MKKKKKRLRTNKGIIIFIMLICVLLFSFLVIRLTKVMIIDKNIHLLKLKELTNKIVEGDSAPRGRIYDRNYKLLVDNKLVPVILYKKENNLLDKDKVILAYKLIEYINIPIKKLSITNLKEFFLINNKDYVNNLITKEEWDNLKNRVLTNKDIYKLKMDRITAKDLTNYTDKDKAAAYVYYLMNKGYGYQESIIKSEDVTDKEVAYLAEHQAELPGFIVKGSWERVYPYGDTFRTILGSVTDIDVGIPRDGRKSYQELGYALNDRVGISYIEKQYESYLKGEKALYRVISSNKKELIKEAKRGKDIVLTIDIDFQQEVDNILINELIKAKSEPNTEYLNRSFVSIERPFTGEVLALSGKQIVSLNNEYMALDFTSGVLTDPMTPGSVVKGASMLVGYNTGVIKIGEVIKDECVKIAGTPKKCSHISLGYINDIKALAQSSNVYQFKIAMKVGGANYKYNAPLKVDPNAFDIYRKTLGEFGLGVKTGIDLPVESLGYIGNKKDSGLLLDLSMGQYDTYTPIQLSQYINTIASDGVRYAPYLVKEIYASSNSNQLGKLEKKIEPVILNQVTTKVEYLDRIKEGFKAVMSVGLGKGVMGTAPFPAGKTGTSESFIDTDHDNIIDSESVSNAFVGYAPYNKPTMSIAVTSPDVEKPSNYKYHSYVNRRIAKKVSSKYFELFN
ncbi:MAG: penicillin-binding protein 2 [Bacilli bacterium]